MTDSTKSELKGKPPRGIPVKSIRPTNDASGEIRTLKYTPILLVQADDGLYYIVDGNHRFFRKLALRDYRHTIPAWVLEEGDQQWVQGDPLPAFVRDWKDGRITLEQLTTEAKAHYKAIAHGVVGALRCFGVLSADEVQSELRRLNTEGLRPRSPRDEATKKEAVAGCVAFRTQGLRRDLLDRMQVLAQEGHMSVDRVLNIALVVGLKALEAIEVEPTPKGKPAQENDAGPPPGPFTRPELNAPRLWQDLYAWSKREYRLSPTEEILALWVGNALAKRTVIYESDLRRAEKTFDKAIRCGYKPPSD